MCDGPNGDATHGPVQRRGGADGWLVDCWSCRAAGLGGGEYLRALAAEVGAPGGGALLDNPLRHLAHLVRGGGTRNVAPAPLPDAADLRRWRRRLDDEPDALAWLARRGIERETARRFGLGFDGAAIVLSVRDASGALVNVRRRYLDPAARPKVLGLAGRGSQLYPDVPPRGPVLLCAGELDALLARQRGLPAVTTTCGASAPDALVGALRPEGRRIAVAYDVGEEVAAEVTAAKLRAAGAEAWAVALGLPEKGDDLTDWFVKYRRSAADLRAVVRRARRAGRAAP